jgi:hypothetical protein
MPAKKVSEDGSDTADAERQTVGITYRRHTWNRSSRVEHPPLHLHSLIAIVTSHVQIVLSVIAPWGSKQ